jgi:hypothetical protein
MRKATWALILAAGLLAWTAPWAGEPPGPKVTVAGQTELGIEVVRVSLSAEGNLVDLRYRVLDPERAKALLAKGAKVYLKDEATGKVLTVPSLSYVGSLQQNSQSPQKGRIYFVLFGNTSHLLKAGSRVTLIIGNAKVQGMVVA